MPSLLLANKNTNRPKETIDFYTQVLSDSKIGNIARHPKNTKVAKKGSLPEKAKNVVPPHWKLNFLPCLPGCVTDALYKLIDKPRKLSEMPIPQIIFAV